MLYSAVVAPKHYRIFSADDEHVATVPPDMVAATLEHYNARRELDVDGNPVGEYRAEPYDGFVQGAA